MRDITMNHPSKSDFFHNLDMLAKAARAETERLERARLEILAQERARLAGQAETQEEEQPTLCQILQIGEVVVMEALKP